MRDESIENQWEFPKYQFTDQRPEDLIVENVRAALLEYLPDEVPYRLKCEMELFEIKNRESTSLLICSELTNTVQYVKKLK